MKISKSLRFDQDLWKLASIAAKKSMRSTTSYIEFSTQNQLKIDLPNEFPLKTESEKSEISLKPKKTKKSKKQLS